MQYPSISESLAFGITIGILLSIFVGVGWFVVRNYGLDHRDIPLVDRENVGFVIVSVLIILAAMAGTVVMDSSVALAVAVFTAVYAFFSFVRLRLKGHPTGTPTVRENLVEGDSPEERDLELKNFGPGPALDFRALARTTSGAKQVTIEKEEYPFNLEEGESVSLLRGDFAERDELDKLSGEIEFYSAFESTDRVALPRDVHNPLDLPITEVAERHDDPRSISIEHLQRFLRGAQSN